MSKRYNGDLKDQIHQHDEEQAEADDALKRRGTEGCERVYWKLSVNSPTHFLARLQHFRFLRIYTLIQFQYCDHFQVG